MQVRPNPQSNVNSAVRRLLPAPLHPYYGYVASRLGNSLRWLTCALDRRTLSDDEFEYQLKNLGLRVGATVYLHVSMDELSRRVPTQNPIKLVQLLKKLIGEEGTLLVPTFPFAGKQYHYIQRQRVFDVERTASKVGLFSEFFRRSPGVMRSLHPTHSVAAWGKHSVDLLAEHHHGTAFGETSPVFKMQQYDGMLIGIGVTPKECFTLFHVAEELHPITNAMQYGAYSVEMTIIHGQAQIPYKVTPLRPEHIRRYDRADKILRKEGILRFYSAKGLRLSVTPVRQFLKRSQGLISQNKFYSRIAQLLNRLQLSSKANTG